jgi:hypothetical protein
MNKQMWIEIFEAAGIDEAARHRWHVAFERRSGDEHHAFLEWLGLQAREVERVREQSRDGRS